MKWMKLESQKIIFDQIELIPNKTQLNLKFNTVS